MRSRKFVVFLVLYLIWESFRSKLFWESPLSLVFVWAIAGLATWPIVRWIESNVRNIPVFETFCLLHIAYYALPGLDSSLSDSTRLLSLTVVFYFLSILQLTFFLFGKSRSEHSVVLTTSVDASHKLIRICLAVILFWNIYEWLILFRLMPNLGSLRTPVSTMFNASGVYSVFYLSFSAGKSLLSPQQNLQFKVSVAAWLLQEFCSGFLVLGITIVIIAGLGYFMAASRVPKFAYLAFALLAILHAGKGEMRQRYWSGDSNVNSNPISLYTFWLTAGVKNISNTLISTDSGDSSARPMDLLRRANLLYILERFVQQSPSARPFLNGKTYWDVPVQLIPRVLWPDKPHSGIATQELCLYYDIQSEEQQRGTVVSVGQIAEGWANGGFLGIAFAAIFMGLIFATASRVGIPNQPTLVGVVCLERAVDLEHCLGQWLIILAISLFAATLLVRAFERLIADPVR